MPVVRRNEPIAQWEEGDFVQGFALVNRKDVRQDRNGRDYFDLELCDQSGSVVAKVWPDSPAIQGRYSEKDFVAYKGTVRLYRDQPQLNLDHCRQASDKDRKDGFDEALLVPSTPEDIDDLKRRLAAAVPGALKRPFMVQLADEAHRRFGERLAEHPAAKTIHHAYRGGLLEHVVTMAELAIKVCDQYPEIDRDLVLMGVYFHDLGKLIEIGAMPRNDYTLEGQLVGHIALGQDLLNQCCDAVEGFPDSLRLHLRHLIVSHHGKREYGSSVEPSTPEAFVLHSIDDLDSKLNQLRNQRRDGASGMVYMRPMGRSILFDTPE